MIYIHPVGGLGNMMFHIASIYSLAKDNDDELCLLNIDKKINDLINDKRCNLLHANSYRFLFERFKNENKSINLIAEYPFEYVPLSYKKNFMYQGYFQTEKYFKHRRNEILNLFESTNEINEIVNKYSKYFGNISLHVRRGDYVKLYPETHSPLDINYYKSALESLPKELSVLVFSDDIEWCKNNFVGERFVFIDEIDYVSIILMSKMKYHIIANSSFSWWGGWLSTYEDKMIIAPKKWFGGKKSGLDEKMNLIPENWIRI